MKHCSLADDLRFYALFNSNSVISGQYEGDNESGCMQWKPLKLFFVLGGGGGVQEGLKYWGVGANSQQAHDVVTMSCAY